MENLLKAIATKISGSALASDVGGRIWVDEYQDDPPIVFPYVIYFIVTTDPDDNFTDEIDDIIIQVSLFSELAGVTEISKMRADEKALFDNCSLTVTGYNMAWMKRGRLRPTTEDVTTVNGNSKVKHWIVEHPLLLEKS